MKTLIICDSSHHGNTWQVAEVMGEVLNAQIETSSGVLPWQLKEFDLVGFGSGIYFGRHAATLRKLAGSLPLEPRRVFVFSTAGLPTLSRFFHGSLVRSLQRRGCEVIDQFSCAGWDTVGPLAWVGGLNRHRPNRQDLEAARAFAQRLQQGQPRLPSERLHPEIVAAP